MAEIKNYDQTENKQDLKSADAEKSDSRDNDLHSNVQELLGGKLTSNITSVRSSKESKKKSLPFIVDIFIGIIILVIAIGVVAGAYFLFRYYSDDFEGVDIEYTFISPCEEDLSVFANVKNSELYIDTENNTFYFGKVCDIHIIENGELGDYLVVKVKANVKYNDGEGYVVGDKRIAVGSEYTLRSNKLLINGTVVELSRYSKTGGN